jgi:D-alanyl-D-alanine dipeptidase
VRVVVLGLLLLAAAPAVAEAQAPRTFVALDHVDATILHDIRYRTRNNFVGRPIRGYRRPLCILTRPAARALKRAQAALRPQGYSLKVYDCYRPQRAVDHFVRWARNPRDRKMKRELYPHVPKSRLFADGYIAERSGHSRGSTVDLTLVKLPAREQVRWRPGRYGACYTRRRYPDNSVPMGTSFDCFDTRSHTLDRRIRGRARRNRLLLKRTLEEAGFENYANEWWHYSLRGEPYPDRYFDFPVWRRSLHR